MMPFAELLTCHRWRIVGWEWDKEKYRWRAVYNRPLRRPPRKIGEERYRPEPKFDPY